MDTTAGSLALLDTPADLVGSIRAGLKNANPTVRAVAARIAGVRGLTTAADDIMGALEVETDGPAEVEEARALLFLRGNSAVDALLQRPYRGNSYVILNVADWVASTHPDDFAGRLEALTSQLGEKETRLGPAVLTVLSTRPDLAGVTMRKWFSLVSPESRSTLMDDRRFDLTNADIARFVAESLHSPDAEMREAITWMLVNRVVLGAALPSAIVDSLKTTDVEQLASDLPSWESFGREMLTRYRGGALVDRSLFLKSHVELHDRDAVALAAGLHLSDRERGVLRSALGERFPSRKAPIEPSSSAAAQQALPMRTLPVFWTGFIDSLMRAANCKPSSSPMFGAIRASYAQDGRPARVGTDASQIPSACAKVLTALARLTLADPRQRPIGADGEVILVPMNERYVQCASEAPGPDPEPPANPKSRVTAPERISGDLPPYPHDLMLQRVEGVVMVTMEISVSGCPRTARVTRSLHPRLDAAALRAASGWRYSTLKVDGKPIPLIMNTAIWFVP